MFIALADSIHEFTQQTAEKLLRLTDSQAAQKPAPGKWSPKEILGHLIDSAANNHQRLVRAQLVDELIFPGYAQEPWVALQGYQEGPWSWLVEFWRLYNWRLTEVMRRIPAGQGGKPCRIGESAAITLHFLAQDYLRHLRHHIDSILR
jgi:hypothetical protein